MEAVYTNKFTEMYEQFKQIPESDRLKYNQDIDLIPMQNTDFDLIQVAPSYFHELQVAQNPRVHITAYVWEPKTQPKGILFFIHGLNGYSGNMAYWADHIRNNNNFVVIGIDCRNFGRSGGVDRGLVSSADYLLTDAEAVIDWGVQKYGSPNRKIFLSGLSMGGAVTLRIALRKKHQYSGVIFFCPAFSMSPISRLNLTWLHYAKIMFFPRTYLFPPTYRTGTRHGLYNQKLKVDKYIYNGEMWAGTINTMRKFVPQTRALYGQFDLPYLFVQSGSDKVVDPFQIRDFERESKSKDKTHFFAKDAWHSICFDIDIFQLVPEISKWLQARA